jgi:xylose isomerase
MAVALGVFGSIDINRGDQQSGWDTDQFPNNVPEVGLALYHILKGGGFTTGGLNFDAKIRRQSLDPDDLLHAHIGGMDVCAQGLLMAAKMIEDGKLAAHVDERYAGWSSAEGRAILNGERSLEDLASRVQSENIEPSPVSGRQEYLENLVNRYC